MIHSFPSGPLATNAIIIVCSETCKAAIVDPAPESASAIIAFLTEHQYTPTQILITHSHWDHIFDVAVLKKKYSLPVYLHRADLPNLEKPGSDGLPLLHSFEGASADGFLEEGDKIQVGKLTFEVIHTPGHTPGGVCFYCREEAVLISGDTLFRGSIGVIHLPHSDPEAMWKSLEKLSKLPPDTRVFPGHGVSTTIGEEHWLPRAKELFQ